MWKKPNSAHIYSFQNSNYLNVEGLREWGYVKMPPIEETLVSYLSQSDISSLKAPTLPSKPLCTTSHLNGRAYAEAGQAGGALHMMAVLQSYQVESCSKIWIRGRDCLLMWSIGALWVTKQTATAIGYSMAAMVATERRL